MSAGYTPWSFTRTRHGLGPAPESGNDAIVDGPTAEDDPPPTVVPVETPTPVLTPPPRLPKLPMPKPMPTGLPPPPVGGLYSMVCASSSPPSGRTIWARSRRRPPVAISTRSRSPTMVYAAEMVAPLGCIAGL